MDKTVILVFYRRMWQLAPKASAFNRIKCCIIYEMVAKALCFIIKNVKSFRCSGKMCSSLKQIVSNMWLPGKLLNKP